MSELYIGLMSGTSLDGVDGALVDFSGQKPRVIGHTARLFAPELRVELLALNSPGENELHRAALAGNALARCYAEVVNQLLKRCELPAGAIRAVGAHGQTVRHRPGEFDADPLRGQPAVGYTLQLNSPALLAELCAIDVVADFRSRDLAAGGQGAPLAPAFHQAWFAQPGVPLQVLNLGGISNLTVLGVDGLVLGFDCGPGNALIDAWCQRHQGQPYDRDGAWAACGQVLPALLATLMAEPFLARPAPKSTGRDLFNAPWLAQKLSNWTQATPVDVQATLTEFTASAVAQAAESYRPAGDGVLDLAVCGGGAYNQHLMQRLQALLPRHRVQASSAWNLPPQEVESVAFAWLARRHVKREPGSLQSVTGARGARVLGALYPA